MTAPELSAREREIVARFEAGETAPESFDATAALRRVLELHVSVLYDRWSYGTDDPTQAIKGRCRVCGNFPGTACPTVVAITGVAS